LDGRALTFGRFIKQTKKIPKEITINGRNRNIFVLFLGVSVLGYKMKQLKNIMPSHFAVHKLVLIFLILARGLWHLNIEEIIYVWV